MKFIIPTMLSLFICVLSFGQAPQINPTTEEEYNYVTKGYRVQVESGLDMKKGYSFTDIGTATKMGSYSYQFKALVREEKQEIAAILAITKSSVSGRVYYFCIPLENPDLYTRYWNDIASWDVDITRPYCYLTSTMLASFLANAQERDKLAKK